MWKYLFLFFIVVFSCSPEQEVRQPFFSVSNFDLDVVSADASIRALEIGPDGTVWYAGSNGRYGYTKDFSTWHHDSLAHEGAFPEFRALAVTDEAVMLLSVASPALLYRTTDQGKSWNLAYQENHEAAFYDAMAFWNVQEGIAMGDPTDGCISIIITRDGGKSWKKVSCEDLPEAAEGEAAFAASNTNISIVGDHTWIATGGKKSRILYSSDKGITWEIFDTPMKQGGTMTGMFTVDFYDEKNGITFGGDWEDKPNNSGNKAITTDGGKTWQLLTDGEGPGYRSCVQYIPGSEGSEIFAVGIPGLSYTSDGGATWELVSKDDFYTIRTTDSVAWLAGGKKLAKLNFAPR